MKLLFSLAIATLLSLGCDAQPPASSPTAPVASTVVAEDTARLADALGVELDDAAPAQSKFEDDSTAVPLDSECCRETGFFICNSNGAEFGFRMCNGPSQDSARRRCKAACGGTSCSVHYPC